MTVTAAAAATTCFVDGSCDRDAMGSSLVAPSVNESSEFRRSGQLSPPEEKIDTSFNHCMQGADADHLQPDEP